MGTHLGLDARNLAAENSYWTAQEICQQPTAWIESNAAIGRQAKRIEEWLTPKLSTPRMRIVLSGAGSSAYVGETLAPWLRRKLARRVDVVSTTDLVGHPSLFLAEDIPTLMISFARSGDSPESVASVDIANHVLSECHHLAVTCNPDGQLARLASLDEDMLCLQMPENTNDHSFAMTSSFTSMLVSMAAIFSNESRALNRSAELAQLAITGLASRARELAETAFGRLVVLGAGCLLATARESSLKCLELTNGGVMAIPETPLGFRHGPKSIVDENTCVLLLRSSDPYTARYDLDLLSELCADGRAGKIVVLDPTDSACGTGSLIAGGRMELVGFPPERGTDGLDDFWMSLPYIVFCQMFAFFKARALGVPADNPCPTGEVNRVVKGVTIYPYRD